MLIAAANIARRQLTSALATLGISCPGADVAIDLSCDVNLQLKCLPLS